MMLDLRDLLKSRSIKNESYFIGYLRVFPFRGSPKTDQEFPDCFGTEMFEIYLGIQEKEHSVL